MSANIYVDGPAVKKLPGFQERTVRDGSGQEYKRYSLQDGIDIFVDGGRWHIGLKDLANPIPAVVAGIVEEISVYEMVQGAHRETGLYSYKSAAGRVESQHPQMVKVRGPKLEDVRELAFRIQAGTIRPDESFEKPQVGPSYKELLAQYEEKHNEALRCWDKISEYDVAIAGYISKVIWLERQLADVVFFAECLRKLPLRTFGKFVWPFCRKTTIYRRLREICDRVRRIEITVTHELS